MLTYSVFLKRCLAKARVLKSDDSGTVAIIFAGVSAAALGILGAAVDYSRAVEGKSRLQSVVDEATLAAVNMPKADQIAFANERIKASLQGSGITFVSCDCTIPEDGVFRAKVKATVKTTALQLASVKSMNVGASATAGIPMSAPTPTDVTFKLELASGYYWKRVNIWTQASETAQPIKSASFTYQPINLRAKDNKLGYGTTTDMYGKECAPDCDKSHMPVGFYKAYLEMEISTDGCEKDYAPDIRKKNSRDRDFGCVPVGTKIWVNRGGNYCEGYRSCQDHQIEVTKANDTFRSFRTNDPETVNHLFVDGVPLKEGTIADVFSFLDCKKTLTHGWEDTPGVDDGRADSPWRQQDIKFTVTVNACAPNKNYKAGGSRLRS